MFGSRQLRLCSLCLCLLLCLANFSVVANAAEDENLVSSNIKNWNLGSNLDDRYVDPDHFMYNADLNTSRIRVRFPSHEQLGFYGISLLYELPEIQVGQNYQFQFTIPSIEVVNQISPHLSDMIPSAFGEDVTMIFGLGYLDSNNSLNFYDNYGFSISYSDFPDVIGQTFKQSFRLDNIKGTPVLGIMLSSVGSSESIVFLQNVSLTKVESDTDKKLDGILGWLQDIWDSITGLPEKLMEKLKSFFIPRDGFFEEIKDDFDFMLSENLGFIYQAPRFVLTLIECVQELLSMQNEIRLVFPGVEFEIAGNYVSLFHDTEVDFSFLDTGIYARIYGMYKVFLYIIFGVALINFAKNTWEGMMSN